MKGKEKAMRKILILLWWVNSHKKISFLESSDRKMT